MRKTFLILASVLAASLLSFRYPDKWTKFTSAEGHYSISFPGTPVEYVMDDSSDISKPVRVHYAAFFPNDSEGYMADWIDMAAIYPVGKPIKEILEESRDGAILSAKAANVITTATWLGKDPYIEFAFTSVGFAGRGRIYVINKFQYAVITLFPLRAGISPDAGKFIKSFKHLQ